MRTNSWEAFYWKKGPELWRWGFLGLWRTSRGPSRWLPTTGCGSWCELVAKGHRYIVSGYDIHFNHVQSPAKVVHMITNGFLMLFTSTFFKGTIFSLQCFPCSTGPQPVLKPSQTKATAPKLMSVEGMSMAPNYPVDTLWQWNLGGAYYK